MLMKNTDAAAFTHPQTDRLVPIYAKAQKGGCRQTYFQGDAKQPNMAEGRTPLPLSLGRDLSPNPKYLEKTNSLRMRLVSGHHQPSLSLLQWSIPLASSSPLDNRSSCFDSVCGCVIRSLMNAAPVAAVDRRVHCSPR